MKAEVKLSERLEAAVERLYEDGMDTRGIADLLRESAELARRVEGAAKIDMPSRIGPRTDGARLVITDKAAERLGIDGRTCRLVPEDDHESKLYPRQYVGDSMNSQKVEPVITQDEYVRYSGGICPACGGWYVEAIEPVRATEAGYARMPVKCVECLATWEEEYALRGFVSLEGY